MVTGILFAFLLPPTTPLWVVAIGAFLAVAVAKELFGGLGKNIFNPALFGRVALMVSPLAFYTTKFVRPFFWRATGFFTPVQTVINNSVSGRAVYQGIGGKLYVNTVTNATPLSLLKSGRLLTTAVTGPTPVGATWLASNGRPSTWSLVQAAPNAPPASPSTVTLKRPVGVRFDESCAGGRSLRRQFAGRSPGCGSGQVLHPPHPYSDP